MKAVFQLLVMVLLYSMSSCQLPGVDLDYNKAVKACGSKLNAVLAQVCRGHQYCGFVKKSLQGSEVGADSEQHLELDLEEQDDVNVPILSKPLAESLFPSTFRRQNRVIRGIVSECCHKTCTVGVVQQYCSC